MRLALACTLVVTACAEARPAPQQRAAALPVTTLSGEAVELGGAGPVRLVELWATWCEPCGEAAARARAVLARHPHVVAYAVALDADPALVRAAVAASPPAGEPLLFRGGAAAAARRGYSAVPTFLAFDTRGRLIGRVTGLRRSLGPELERLLRNAEGGVGERD